MHAWVRVRLQADATKERVVQHLALTMRLIGCAVCSVRCQGCWGAVAVVRVVHGCTGGGGGVARHSCNCNLQCRSEAHCLMADTVHTSGWDCKQRCRQAHKLQVTLHEHARSPLPVPRAMPCPQASERVAQHSLCALRSARCAQPLTQDVGRWPCTMCQSGMRSTIHDKAPLRESGAEDAAAMQHLLSLSSHPISADALPATQHTAANAAGKARVSFPQGGTCSHPQQQQQQQPLRVCSRSRARA